MRNQYEVQGDVICINVWHKDKSLCALVDAVELPWLLERKVQWYAAPAAAPIGKYYAFAKFWNPEAGKNRTVGLHQYIMGTVGMGRGIEVHHKDNDGLNCKRSNMRVVDHRGNCRERKPGRDWAEHDRK